MRKAKRINYVKWLLICFPYGLYLMWQHRCRWNRVIKAGVTMLFTCAALGILLVPIPERADGTRTQIIETEPNANIFGPEMPEGYNMSDYVVAEGGLDLIGYAH